MEHRSQALFKWVASLPLFAGKPSPVWADFQDGILLGRILKEEIDPIHFSNLKTSPSQSTPLVKVMGEMKNYILLQGEITIASSILPNPAKIVSSADVHEITRLLQLLIGCAVNSPQQENFIGKIRDMKPSDQEVIMEAIQELLKEEERGSLGPLGAHYDPSEVAHMKNEMQALLESKDQLSQKCHNLTAKLGLLSEEKNVLQIENEKLTAQLEQANIYPDSFPSATLPDDTETKKEMERLREENFKLEAQLDDYKIKAQGMEKRINEANAKNVNVASLTDEIIRLKDQVDAHREAADKARHHEATIASYKKKLEEMVFIKRAKKEIEDKYDELLKEKIGLEDKWKNHSSQMDMLKKNLEEAQQLVSSETQKALQLEFDGRVNKERLEGALETIQRLEEEKERLSGQVEELRMEGPRMGTGIEDSTESALTTIPPNVREKIVRLEMQNKRLLEQMEEVGSGGDSNEIVVDVLRKKEKQLNESLLQRNHEINELRNSSKLSDDKILMLQAQLQAKEEELRKKENQYKKCMDKAREVITTLGPSAVADLGDTAKFDVEFERTRAVREMEEKLLASAFYNMGMSLHRNSVENRNTLLAKSRYAASHRRRSDM